LAEGTMLSTEIPGAQLVVLDHCGHIPQFECAAPFNATLLKFLNAGSPAQPTASKQ
jgi:pimeloyl-ACP methyl ester carboxylesterase